MTKLSKENINERIINKADLPDPINRLIQEALSENATDIHIDTLEDVCVIRFRIGGIIYENKILTCDEGKRLLNEIKVISGLDIDKTFTPKEGHIEFRQKEVKENIRVTIIPTGDKESAHLRIISKPIEKWDINNLGFCAKDKQKILKALNSPSGLILVSGQTGTGKTTTLYSLTSTLNLQTSIGVSIEDPVEFNLPCLRQLEVNESHGLTMAEGIKSLLRTDPDIIVVGEIRDKESAITAAKAALAGRLVIATIHSKSVSDTIDTLHYMSVPYYVIGTVLHMIINQKLVRRLCKKCCKLRELSAEEIRVFKNANIKAPKEVSYAVGCDECNSRGYKRQIGIFEVMISDDNIRDAISKPLRGQELQNIFIENGMTPVLSDALQKVIDGETSFEEISRIFWLDNNNSN